MSEQTTDTGDNQEEVSTEAALEGVTPPVENEAVDSKTDETSENVAPQNDDTTVQDSAKPDDNDPEKLRKAIATEAFEKREAKRETLRVKAENERLKAAQSQPTPTSTDQVAPNAIPAGQTEALPNLPTLEDPDVDFDQGKLNAKMVTYHRDVARITIAEERKKERADRSADEAQGKLDDFWTKSTELRKKDETYEKLVESNGDVLMSDTLRAELIDSDNGAELHKHLLENPELIESINGMVQRDAIREIAKIEFSLSDTTSRAQKSIKETNAPKVIDTGSGGGGPVQTLENAGSMDEYYERYMAGKDAEAAKVHAQ